MSVDSRVRFQQALNAAITLGCMPAASVGLGPDTLAALGVVAREHPDSAVELITDAYDAFTREHG